MKVDVTWLFTVATVSLWFGHWFDSLVVPVQFALLVIQIIWGAYRLGKGDY